MNTPLDRVKKFKRFWPKFFEEISQWKGNKILKKPIKIHKKANAKRK